MNATTAGAKIVGPGDGTEGFLGSIGVRWLIDGIEDLDLLLFDPNGVLAQQDPAQDRFPTLGVQTELCPPSSGAYRLQASLYKGDGAYVVRSYRTP